MTNGLAVDHRTALRRRTLLSGKIVFKDGFSVADCTVRNLSESGACLELPSVAGIPSDFELIVEPNGVRRKCHAVWTRGRRIGVAFEA